MLFDVGSSVKAHPGHSFQTHAHVTSEWKPADALYHILWPQGFEFQIMATALPKAFFKMFDLVIDLVLAKPFEQLQLRRV